MKGFFDFVPGDSFLHRLNPLTKLLFALALTVSCFISDQIFFVLAIIGVDLFLAALAGVLNRGLAVLKALTKISIVLFIIQVLFIRDGAILFTLPLLDIPITKEGVEFSLLFVFRFIAATMPLPLVLSVTKMNDLSNIFVEKLRVPYRYAFSLTVAIRFIPVFADEMAGVMEAQIARGVAFDTKNMIKKIRLILPLCVPLLISSVKKIESAAISAELRGFHCRKRGNCYKEYPFLPVDFLAFTAIVVMLTSSILI